MRKSMCPTQLKKRGIEVPESLDFVSPSKEPPGKRRKCKEKNEVIYLPPTRLSHEEIMKKLIAPLKINQPNGVMHYRTKTLGFRRGNKPRRPMYDPNAINALILYTPPEMTEQEKLLNPDKILVHVVVDPILSNILRPHQREGVKFMYDCVTGIQIENNYGCIMADEMGLGKTLQCITLLWTLLRQGPNCTPTINKAIIVCPSSLVKNWFSEINKWLNGRLSAMTIDGGPKLKSDLERFMTAAGCTAIPVLIISYETFRKHAEMLQMKEIGLVICDEGHRLKNCENQTYKALMGLKGKRRILLSGTPIQNDLTEYFSLIHFVNEGLLGSAQEFRRKFENYILKGQDRNSTEIERQQAIECQKELRNIVEKCMIRRTSNLLTKYLPIKFEMIVCCKLSPIQEQLYLNFINSESIRKAVKDVDAKKNAISTLASITSLKKLCNHPDLIMDKIIEGAEGFEKAHEVIPVNQNSRDIHPEYSGKLMLLDCLLAKIKVEYGDKIVLVSNYTQTLDLFEKLCKKRTYRYVRLDGTMSIKKRAKVVEQFNKSDSEEWIFMLSSKAGGCGLNLIGANRLVMFDPDWNPANDDQAMARVWRDGQKKPCFIYRFLTTGTIEEKIFQRQAHKKALSATIVDNMDDMARHFTSEELKQLFKLEKTESDTHDTLKCKRCMSKIQIKKPPEEADCTSDLSNWYHAWNKRNLCDDVLKQIWDIAKYITFVFHQRTANQIVKPVPKELGDIDEEKENIYEEDEID